MQNKKTTEEHMVDFLKSFQAIEDAMEPFKDQRRDLRENFHENGWLSKEEMRMAVKAYRFMKQDIDLDEMKDIISKLKLKGFRNG
jgi:hypothetical protein|tara:strand:+ start:585 stop:839 length:255 start_codon:yes stop_codon:yes gene_type:complete